MMFIRLGGGLFLALTLVACSGSGDGPGSDDGTTENTASSSEGGTVGVVTEAGVIVRGPDGLVVDVPPGALPLGAEVSVEAVDSLGVAAELSTVGNAYRIETDGDLSEPVGVAFPVPDGEDSQGLALAHSRDGRVDLVGGQVVEGVFHTALASFSDVQLVRSQIDTILDIADVADEWTLDGISGDMEAMAVEAIQIATGRRSEPVPRVVSIVGPTEAVPGRPAVYTATGFESAHPEFVEYEWRLSGRNEAGVTTDGLVQRSLWVGFQATGRYVVTVDVRDPVTGAEAFAALTVFVDEEAFGVYAVPDLMGASRVEIGVVNSVGEIDLIWGFSDGFGGRQTIATRGEPQAPGKAVVYGPVFFGTQFKGEDLLFEVVALDSAGGTATAAVVLPVPSDSPTAMISGPTTIEAGTPGVFTAVVANTEGMELTWSASNAVRMESAGDSMTASWQDPAVWSASAGGGVDVVVLSGTGADGERVDLDWHYVAVLPSTDAAGETGETDESDEPDVEVAVPEVPLPRTYVGDGVQTISFAGTVGACSIPNSSIALTLFPDGRAEAVYNSESPEITVNTVDDVHELVCRNHAPYTVTLEGHHEDGHVVILISTGDLPAFEGDYTADELVIDWRFTRDHPDDDVMVQSIVDYDFHLLHQGG